MRRLIAIFWGSASALNGLYSLLAHAFGAWDHLPPRSARQ
jgi:hypothetical protein